ncbi:MAG: hypothetical protein ABR541_07535 [Candidatus Dormibacteria bacterium]
MATARSTRLNDFGHDTELDAIAAQARSHPPLSVARVAPLLVEARTTLGGPASATLVEHHLSVALDAALARRGRGLPVGDLYQEGAIALVVAVDEYAARDGAPSGLRAYVERVVALHLDAALEKEATAVAAELVVVRDAELLSAAEVRLRRQLGRPATALELGGLLNWPPERVEMVSAVLHEAQGQYDMELLDYLDDADDEE